MGEFAYAFGRRASNARHEGEPIFRPITHVFYHSIPALFQHEWNEEMVDNVGLVILRTSWEDAWTWLYRTPVPPTQPRHALRNEHFNE